MISTVCLNCFPMTHWIYLQLLELADQLHSYLELKCYLPLPPLGVFFKCCCAAV